MRSIDHPGAPVAATLVALGALLGTEAADAQPCFDVGVFAGRGVGDGLPGAEAFLSSPRHVEVDGAGNVFIADAENQRVRRLDAASGLVSTVAGNGAPGVAQDGDPGTLASLSAPSGLAVLPGGELLIADTENDTVWRLGTDGALHRFAGSGVRTGSVDGPGGDATDDLNDGELATIATFSRPVRVAVDAAGSVYVSDLGNQRVRKVDAASGRISTFAAGLNQPVGLGFGPTGDLFVADRAAHQVFRVSGGTPVAIAGIANTPGPPVNGIPALGAALNGPAEVAVDGAGVVYIADTDNNMIRRVTTDGTIEQVVGDGFAGFREGPKILARFRHPGVTLASGVLYIPDADNNRVRRYDPATDQPTITLAGGDNLPGDGGPATQALLNRPTGLAVNGGGSVYIGEHDSHRVRRVDANGTITTVVNQSGRNGSAQDGQPAINQALRKPTGVAVDAAGNLLIADADDHRVLIVGSDGIIRTFAGNGTAAFGGDDGPAASAMLNTPLRMALAGDGSVFIADFNNHRIRRVDANGIITTVAGTGTPGGSGDGGPATAARLNNPSGLTFDAAGNLYIADFGNHRVRRIDTGGVITTIAGSGTPGGLGDGGGAGAAQLNKPTDVALMADGALLIVDQANHKIRYVAPGTGGTIDSGSVISTLLGSGQPGATDGPGPRATLLIPTDVAVTPAGDILIADRGNQLARKATPGTDCAGPIAGPCRNAADCDDDDACTVDTCQGGSCTNQRIASDACQPLCSAQANGCIPGGGPARFDCLGEALVQGPLALKKGRPAPVVRCRDGDTACDFDTTAGTCTFRLAWCLNQEDSRIGCTANGVSKVVAKGITGDAVLRALAKLGPSSRAGKALLFNPPFTTPSVCTELMGVPVALRGTKPGKLKLKATAVGSGRPRGRDADTLRLFCLP
jgi:sugar lactone lactonase YvrE